MSRDQLDSHIDADPAFLGTWSPLLDYLRLLAKAQAARSKPVPPFNHSPSRAFLIEQAVLNALAQHMPAATRLDGAPAAMRHLVALCGWDHGQPSRWFIRSVRDHYAILRSQYA